MSWTLDYSTSDRILIVKCEGPFTANDLDDMTRASVDKLRKEHALRVLLDFSASYFQVNVAKLYDLPELYTALRAHRLTHIAIVIPADGQPTDALQFYEDLAVNRGYFARLFSNYNNAKTWLMEFKDQ